MIPHSRPFVGDEEAEAAARVVRSGMLAQGPEVEAFEQEFAAYLGRRHAVAVSSGTAALHLALHALELPEHAEVAYPAYTCAALPCAIAMAGLTARPVDVDADGNLDVDAVPADSNAVLLPHLFGKSAVIPEGSAPVIEDLAQSIGNGTGRAGIMAIASFYATKMLTTGEGGMVFTDDDALAEAVRDLRDYDKRGDGRMRFNYKMTDIQAAIGRVQLGRLDGFITRRREIAARYTDAFWGLPLALPSGEGHAYYRYAVRTQDADAFIASLYAGGVDAKGPVHPPGPLAAELTGAASAFAEFVSIPLYPAMTDEEVQEVIAAVRDALG